MTDDHFGFVPVEALHLMCTAQHVAPFFSQLLQGSPAVVQLLHIAYNMKQHSSHTLLPVSGACFNLKW